MSTYSFSSWIIWLACHFEEIKWQNSDSLGPGTLLKFLGNAKRDTYFLDFRGGPVLKIASSGNCSPGLSLVKLVQ